MAVERPFSSDAAFLRTYFATNFAALRPTTAIVFENAPASDPPTDAPHVRFYVRRGLAQQASIGGGGGNGTRVFRNNGILEAAVFVPLQTGDGLLLRLADDVWNVLAARTLRGDYTDPEPPQREYTFCVRLRAPRATPAYGEAEYYRASVLVDYQSDFESL